MTPLKQKLLCCNLLDVIRKWIYSNKTILTLNEIIYGFYEAGDNTETVFILF